MILHMWRITELMHLLTVQPVSNCPPTPSLSLLLGYTRSLGGGGVTPFPFHLLSRLVGAPTDVSSPLG